jgi:hypothetical protein
VSLCCASGFKIPGSGLRVIGLGFKFKKGFFLTFKVCDCRAYYLWFRV